MEVQAVAQLAREPEVVRVDGRDVDWDPRVLDRSGREERGGERDRVMLAPKAHRSLRLPGVPEGPQGEDVLAEPRTRGRPLDGEPPLHVALDLRPEPEDQTAT